MSKKEIDEELKRHDNDFAKKVAFDLNAVKFGVGFRWNKGGREDEARDCFNLFDKRAKNFISASDLKVVLGNYLEFPVDKEDIEDFVAECGGNNDPHGNIAVKDFAKLYLS